MKKFIISFTLFVFCFAAIAQKADTLGSSLSLNQREVQVIMQQWATTDNAAGLAFANVNRGGFTTLDWFNSGGDHHRVQEGSQNSGLTFFSEGFSSFSEKILARGQFVFNKNLESDRAWSDVVNTYNANPYIFGSSVRGDYDSQVFDLNLKVYTVPFGRVNFGLTLDYHVADISRQRDPRSRTYMIDYAAIPSVIYAVTQNSRIGINALYRFDKERMPNLSTVQTDPNLQYYTFTGLQNAQGRIGGYRGFQRQFISEYFGGALQYNYDSENIKFLLSAGYNLQNQETLGDKKQSPGSYNANNFDLVSNLIVRNDDFLHQVLLTAAYIDGGADEFRQTLFSERDEETGASTEYWVTDYKYVNRYVAETYNAHLDWTSYRLRENQQEYYWSAGVEAGFNAFSNTYYLPTSHYEAQKLYGGIKGSVFVLDRNYHRLEIGTAVRAGYTLNAELDLIEENEISTYVLRPDLDYHMRNTLELSGSLKYTFPMKFVERTSMSGYARIYGGKLFAENSHDWFTINVAIGLLTF